MTEIWYTFLSLTSKLILGSFLLANVLLLDRASDGASGN